MGASADNLDRASIVDANFINAVTSGQLPTSAIALGLADVHLTQAELLDLFESQLISRHLDLIARELKRKNQAFYTIGSSGHEGMAAVAKALHVDDMAFLHYRDAGFYIQRAKSKYANEKIIRDLLLSLVAAKDDPIAAGRHKVLGSKALSIPPQTSTIASHLPKVVGAAASIKRAHILNIQHPLPDDGVVLGSFGDASCNHASALAAFNSAQWLAHDGYPLPLIFVCEDNGWGISVPTPSDWIESLFGKYPFFQYLQADGLHILDLYRQACAAEKIARRQKKPVFLHVKCVRLLGHAGTDVELQYRSKAEIEATEQQDPLLHTARIILELGALSATDIVQKYQAIGQQVQQIATEVVGSAQLASRAAVMAAIVPPVRNISVPPLPALAMRQKVFGDQFAKLANPLNLSQAINAVLTDLMLQYQNIIVFGEDVAQKGGVYRVTADLRNRFRPARVFNSVLDEQSILGYAIGHAHNGFLPIPEIQYLAYLHNAEDQLRGEAATLSFFSNGQFTNPMVIRIASFAYQRGFGGHFHNDNSFAVLRDIPGIIIACPSNAADAATMLRTCVELAYIEQRIVVFLEPIALYMKKDLHTPGDQAWLFNYPAPHKTTPFGELAVYGDATDTVILTYGNAVPMSLQAAKILKESHQTPVKVIDLRWLKPLPEPQILNQIANAKHVAIIDESRQTASLSEQLVTLIATQSNPPPKLSRLTGADSFISLGDSWQHLLPSPEEIVRLLK